MKTESTVKYVLRLALTLLAITAVVAVILAGVSSVTAPRIAELNAEKTAPPSGTQKTAKSPTRT